MRSVGEILLSKTGVPEDGKNVCNDNLDTAATSVVSDELLAMAEVASAIEVLEKADARRIPDVDKSSRSAEAADSTAATDEMEAIDKA